MVNELNSLYAYLFSLLLLLLCFLWFPLKWKICILNHVTIKNNHVLKRCPFKYYKLISASKGYFLVSTTSIITNKETSISEIQESGNTGELGYDRLNGTRKIGPSCMQNPSYTYDENLICIGLGPSISSVICNNPLYSGPHIQVHLYWVYSGEGIVGAVLRGLLLFAQIYVNYRCVQLTIFQACDRINSFKLC